MAEVWKWRLLLPNGAVTYTDYPAGEFPTGSGWERVDTSEEVEAFNDWDYGDRAANVNAMVSPESVELAESGHVNPETVSTSSVRSDMMKLQRYQYRSTVNFIGDYRYGIFSKLSKLRQVNQEEE